MPSADTIRIGKEQLTAFVADLFTAAGVPSSLAKQWAIPLTWAEARGIESHGVLRVGQYLGMLERNEINRNPDIHIARRAGATALLEADLAPGPVAMSIAMREAIDLAATHQVGWCVARNVAHAGALGYVALQAVTAPRAAIVMGASSPLMAYHGARVSSLGTNPIAIAFPTRSGPPFLLDMSTSTAARGRIMKAAVLGEKIPTGWGIDADGRDTTDPASVATLLPLAGAKGSGLSFMLECLASLTAGNPILAPLLGNPQLAAGARQNGVALVVDLAAFGDAAAMLDEADELRRAIAALPRAEGVERLYLPGEIEDERMRQRERDGIPLAAITVEQLSNIATSLGVASPFEETR